ncbi:MAG: UDP-2,3-diacylglucosamine diphosphatase [Rikenellaceae bacterium]
MYYFASDIHLGGGGRAVARETESRFVEWLERAAEDAEAILLCGDIFDIWFENKRVVPKGFTRTLGTLSRLTDRGVRVIFMAGNHDMWLGDYLADECGLEIYRKPTIFEFAGKRVHVAHGDNLKLGRNWSLRLMNILFHSKFVYRAAARVVHPDLLLKFGHWWSEESRRKHRKMVGHNTIDGYGVRSLIEYATEHQATEPCDYYIFGHLHQMFDYQGDGFRVLFTNDWSEEPHVAALDSEGNMRLESFRGV